MKTIDFASGIDLPLEAVTQTFGVIGRKGSGKTYAAQKLCEGMLGADAQVVVLDPVGNWYGLRLAADGKGNGFSIPVFGGLHGDVSLEPTGGALVADLVVDRGLSAVLDVSQFRHGERKRFVTAFAEQLFHRKKAHASPLHVFVEEAQVFVPQRVMGEDARMLGAMEDIVRMGRNYGLGATLISQRPQSVNKEVLSQTECLVVLQVNESQARKALRDWIVDAGLDVKGLVDTLPSLGRGEAWVWSPGWLRVTKRVHIKKKKTLDASATPVVGAKKVEPRELAPVDLVAIRAAMADTVKKAEESDPKLLRKRIAELERKVAAKAPPAPRPAKTPKRVEVPVLRPTQERRIVTLSVQAADRAEKLTAAVRELLGALAAFRAPHPRPIVPVRVAGIERAPPSPARALPVSSRRSRSDSDVAGDAPGLKLGARQMLAALAQMHPKALTRHQVGTWVALPAGGSTFGTYLSQLKRGGLVEEIGGLLRPTAAGIAAAGEVPAPPSTTAEMVQQWGSRFKAGARQMLEAVVAKYPTAVTREELGEQVGLPHTGSTFGTYLSTLRRNGLVEVNGGEVAASETLFLGGAA